jgi:hypothetical protein
LPRPAHTEVNFSEAAQGCWETREAMVNLLRELSHSSGKEVVADVCRIATDAFKQNHLNMRAFEIGVFNVLVSVYLFGSQPAYFPLYALLQAPLLFFFLFRTWVKKRCLLYFTELCWVLNVSGWWWLALEFAESQQILTLPVDPKLRLQVSRAYFALANGPLLAFVVIGGNALVFHDIERTNSLFIHLFPALSTYLMRWHGDKMMQTWPGLFGLSSQTLQMTAAQRADASDAMVYHAICVYFLWWSIYGTWLLWVGCELPGRYNVKSVFGNHDKNIQKLFGVKALRMKAVVYLGVHAVAVCLLLYLTRFLYASFKLHTAAISLVCLSPIHQGARYYHYSFGVKFEKILKQALEAETASTKTQ